MDQTDIKLTSSEIGSLWGEYVNGTMTDIVNKYMLSIIEDESIKNVFNLAVKTFGKQKKQIAKFLKNEKFPVPIGFNDTDDLNQTTERLFTDTFCLVYLHIMTIHGMLGHMQSLNVSTRKDLREFYSSCDEGAKTMYDKTIELLLKKGNFQRDPYFYPYEKPEFVSTKDFADGFFGKGRRLAATEIIGLSLDLKKNIMAKTLSIAFSQVAHSQDVKNFLKKSEKTSNDQIQSFAKILHQDNLPVPTSWETEVTNSKVSPFSDKLMIYHIGFLFQVAQVFHGRGLAAAMRTDLATTYEKVILKNLTLTKEWLNLMVKHKWLEQPPLAPNRKELAKGKG